MAYLRIWLAPGRVGGVREQRRGEQPRATSMFSRRVTLRPLFRVFRPMTQIACSGTSRQSLMMWLSDELSLRLFEHQGRRTSIFYRCS